jgi:hypothetical protein
LGELVVKLGERVLGEIFPILREGLRDEKAQTRQGACLGLAEVLSAARKEQLEDYLHQEVVPAIRDALCDSDHSVRNAAGAAFDAVFKHGGADTAAVIVPALLEKLDDGDGDDSDSINTALEGLKQVLKAQPKILASVLPKLASPPINAQSASTISALAEVAGAALPPHLEILFPPLLVAMGSSDDEEATAAMDAATSVLRAVPDDAHYLLIPEVLGGLSNPDSHVRAAACKLCGVFATEAPCFDEEDDVPRLIEGLFGLFVDSDESVVLSAWTALGVVMGKVQKEDQGHYLRDVRSAVESCREKVRRQLRDEGVSTRELLIPGMCLPKGLAPVVQVFLQGVLAGRNSDQRESAAEGLREAVLSTTPVSIKPHVIPITGPLIRVLGDKHSGSVKAAVLSALAAMIEKGGVALKPFVPQLQTTFVKCLVDPARAVRQRAACALGRLVVLQPRVDALVADLVNGMGNDQSQDSVEATLRAVAGAFAHAGSNVKPPTVLATKEACWEISQSSIDQQIRAAAALALAHCAAYLEEDERVSLIENLGDVESGDDDSREHRALSLSTLARTHPELLLASHASATLNGLARHARDTEREGIRSASILGMGRLALASFEQSGKQCPYFAKIAPALARALRDDLPGVRTAAAYTLSTLCKECVDAVQPHLGAFVPQLADVASTDKSKDARHYADKAVRYALKVEDTEDGLLYAQEQLRAGGPANAARQRLSDVVLRRLKGIPEDDVLDGQRGVGSLAADVDDDDDVVLGDA